MYQKYLDYIANTGGSPTIKQFDEDWEPIGPMVRQRMGEVGLIRYSELGETLHIEEEKNV